jgi:hypothetical protein
MAGADEELRRRVLNVQLVVRVRFGFAPAWCRARGRGRNGRARLWRFPSRGTDLARCRGAVDGPPRAASGAPGRGAHHMLRSSEAGIDSAKRASGASEEAQLCRTDGGVAEDRGECALAPSLYLICGRGARAGWLTSK